VGEVFPGRTVLLTLFWVPHAARAGWMGCLVIKQARLDLRPAPHRSADAQTGSYERWLVRGPCAPDPGGPMAIQPRERRGFARSVGKHPRPFDALITAAALGLRLRRGLLRHRQFFPLPQLLELQRWARLDGSTRTGTGSPAANCLCSGP